MGLSNVLSREAKGGVLGKLIVELLALTKKDFLYHPKCINKILKGGGGEWNVVPSDFLMQKCCTACLLSRIASVSKQ